VNADGLVDELRRGGIQDPAVLEAIRRVPRDRFVPPERRRLAWWDEALPIGEGQTISQPWVVAFMTACARLRPGDRVLEIGTGSGYQAAVLAEVLGLGPATAPPAGRRSWLGSVERLPTLHERAARTLADLGYGKVALRLGDGARGWPERAPFDAIVVTAAAGRIPPDLLDQLAPGGRLVIPVRGGVQRLHLVTRTTEGFETELSHHVLFVPLIEG
jgi:protein-L-isoaspartate(D-aspartate) O-methyltransferase